MTRKTYLAAVLLVASAVTHMLTSEPETTRDLHNNIQRIETYEEEKEEETVVDATNPIAPLTPSYITFTKPTILLAPMIEQNEKVLEEELHAEEVSESEPETLSSETKNDNHETEALSHIEKDPPMSYTDEDLFYLAAAVCREAGGASEEIQLLVANVVINRVCHSIYPDTIYEVLTQPNQYGTMCRDGISFPSWADDEVQKQCYSVARRILDGERVCPENVLFQAEFVQGSSIFKQFDGYYFCYYE